MDPQILAGPLKIQRKAVLKIGMEIFIYDQSGKLVLFIKQKGFKLKEDIRVYSDESKSEELLSIQARKVMDFNAAFDVVDSATGQKLGGMRRKGFSSMIRDEWIILDGDDNQIGSIHEDTMALALVRRFVSNLVPQKFEFVVNGQTVAELKQRFNPVVLKADFHLLPGGAEKIDPRLAVAGVVMLMVMEGRQG